MNKKARIAIFITVVIVLCLTIYLSYQIVNKQDKQSNENNTVATNNIISNNIITNNVKVEETKNAVVQNNTVKQPTSNNIGPDTKESKEKAIQLVKDDWGDDSSVYYYVDEVKENGKYTVSIRDSATTSVIVWYEVDLKNNTAVMQ